MYFLILLEQQTFHILISVSPKRLFFMRRRIKICAGGCWSAPQVTLHTHFAICYSTSPIPMGRLPSSVYHYHQHTYHCRISYQLMSWCVIEQISFAHSVFFIVNQTFQKVRVIADPLWSSIYAGHYRTLWRKYCILTHICGVFIKDRLIYRKAFIGCFYYCRYLNNLSGWQTLFTFYR